MSFISVAILGSGVLGAGANLLAGSTIAGGEKAAQGTIQSMLNQGIGQVQGAIQPATQAIQQGTDRGVGTIGARTQQGVDYLSPYAVGANFAMPNLQKLLTPGQMPDLSQIPGFAEALKWGGMAIDNSSTVSGLGGNSAAAQSLMGGQLGMSAYNSLVGNTMGAANIGAGAAGNIGSLLGNAGIAAGGLQATAGSNIGGVYTGAGNTIADMMGTAGGNIAQAQLGATQAIGGSYTGAAQAASNPIMMLGLLQGLNKKGATG